MTVCVELLPLVSLHGSVRAIQLFCEQHNADKIIRIPQRSNSVSPSAEPGVPMIIMAVAGIKQQNMNT